MKIPTPWPFSRGLVDPNSRWFWSLPVLGFWPMWQGSGTIFIKNIARHDQHDAVFPGTSADPAWTIREHGVALHFDNVNDQISAGSGGELDDAEPFTVLIYVRPDSADTGSALVINKSTTSNENGVWWFNIHSGTWAIQFLKVYTSNDLDVKTATNFVIPDEFHLYAATWDGTDTASTGVKLYRDDRETPSYSLQQNGTGTKSSDAAHILHFGSRGTGLSHPSLCDVSWISLVDRVMTPFEIAKVARDPYGMIRQVPRLLRTEKFEPGLVRRSA